MRTSSVGARAPGVMAAAMLACAAGPALAQEAPAAPTEPPSVVMDPTAPRPDFTETPMGWRIYRGDAPGVTPPAWLRTPQAAFPERAAARGIENGLVVIQCVATPEGTLIWCELTQETPPDAGFGQAVMNAVGGARVRPAIKDGQPVGSVVRYRQNFMMQQ